MLRLYASPDAPATLFAPMYCIHDHRQTQVDRVSLQLHKHLSLPIYTPDKSHKYTNGIPIL